MARMFLVCGMSGGGKTRFSKILADKLNLLYFSPDEYYEKINGDSRDRSNTFKVWHTMYADIHEAEVNEQDCVIDTNAVTYSDRQEFLNWFPTFDHFMIYIDTPFCDCLENNRNRYRVIPDDIMYDMYANLEEPDEWEDERWLSLTKIKNIDNNFVLQGIYMFIEEGEKT